MMKFLLKRSRGMTLVEVLAALVIVSIIIIFIFNIIKSSTIQGVQQTKETNNLFDTTYTLKVLTKDIRRSISVETTQSQLKLTFPSSVSNNNTVTYFLENRQLKRRNKEQIEIITDNISCAQFTSPKQNVISIKLSHNNDCSESKSTEVYLRTGEE